MNTIQNIFQRFYDKFLKRHRVSAEQAKVANDIMNCRTAAFGGRVSKCEKCGFLEVLYNSCRNRHCPLCQGIVKTVWIDQRTSDILDAPYFHIVFTVPCLMPPVYMIELLSAGYRFLAGTNTDNYRSFRCRYGNRRKT